MAISDERKKFLLEQLLERTDITPEDHAFLLEAELRRVQANKGFWPNEEIWALQQALTSQAAAEVLLFVPGKGNVLFRRADDAVNYAGQLHFPGGFIKPRQGDGEPQKICEQQVGKDLKELGLASDAIKFRVINPEQPLFVKIWAPGSHAVGNPVSIGYPAEIIDAVPNHDRILVSSEVVRDNVATYHDWMQEVLLRWRQQRNLDYRLGQ